MELERVQTLDSTIAAIQARWGHRSIVSARELAREPGIASGAAALDALLPGGGFPRGHLSEIYGYGTCGALPIAARSLAQAQYSGQRVIVVDATGSVDLVTLEHCGVNLDALALLHASGLQQALQMTTDLLRVGFAGALLFDRLRDLYALAEGAAISALEQALRDWGPLLARNGATLFWLTELSAPGAYPDGLPLAYAADLRLLCERTRWLTEGRRVTGYAARVTVAKSRGGAQEQSAMLRFVLR